MRAPRPAGDGGLTTCSSASSAVGCNGIWDDEGLLLRSASTLVKGVWVGGTGGEAASGASAAVMGGGGVAVGVGRRGCSLPCTSCIGPGTGTTPKSWFGAAAGGAGEA